MNRLLAALAVTALVLGAPAAAGAAKGAKKPSPRAKILRANLASAPGTSAYGAVTGKAQVVDNKKRDNATIHIRGLLQKGATYSWSIFEVTGDGAACDPANAGDAVTAFKYKPLRINAAGNANATAKSKTFVAESGTRYAVAVRNADGVVVACGELKRKKAPKKKGASKKGASKKPASKGKGRS